MAKTERRPNPIVLRQGMTIGSSSAETDDEFLFECFVHYPPVDLCTRVQSPAMIVAGRTGAGKTAILRHIERQAEHSVEIDPAEMAMSYVSNSDALNFLQAIGADLDLLFQVLWKHVLCIEFIRLKWSIDGEERSRSIFMRLFERFVNDPRKQRAIQYLRAWEGKFWITMDQNIRELTEKVEGRLHAELGGEIQKFRAGGQYEKRLSTEKKSELVARARKIINANQLSELNSVIEILGSSDLNDSMNKYYILIDKLDNRWVDTAIRFRLIRSLIESLRTFRRITNLKILVALRTDILERVVQETSDITFQREKFEDYFVRLRWTKSELKQLVNKRIDALLKRQYSGKTIYFEDVFRHRVGNQDPFDYMIDRTLMRPRDIIAFVNECIRVSEGQYDVSATHVRRAELEFSRIRRDALEQEWLSAFPSLRKLLDYVSKPKKIVVDMDELCSREHIDELTLSVCASGKIDRDPIFELCRGYVVDNKFEQPIDVAKAAIAILYRVGAVGVKIQAGDKFLYSHVDQPIISADILTTDVRVRIHPMLYGALRIGA